MSDYTFQYRQYPDRILATLDMVKLFYSDYIGLLEHFDQQQYSFPNTADPIWAGGPSGQRVNGATDVAASTLFYIMGIVDDDDPQKTLIGTDPLPINQLRNYQNLVAVSTHLDSLPFSDFTEHTTGVDTSQNQYASVMIATVTLCRMLYVDLLQMLLCSVENFPPNGWKYVGQPNITQTGPIYPNGPGAKRVDEGSEVAATFVFYLLDEKDDQGNTIIGTPPLSLPTVRSYFKRVALGSTLRSPMFKPRREPVTEPFPIQEVAQQV